MENQEFALTAEQPSVQNDIETASIFADSVDAYTVGDMHPVQKERKRTKAISLLMRCSVIAVCIGILGYSAYMIINKVVEDKLAESAYDELRVDSSDFTTVEHSKNLKEPNSMPTVLEMLGAEGNYEDYIHSGGMDIDEEQRYKNYYQNYLRLSETYKDMYGWIYMSDTQVDYPMMKDRDNMYYLYRNYKGEWTRSGSICADCNLANNFFANYNMVIYGHNMKDGSMFHSVAEWCNDAKIETYVKTTQIELYTDDGLYIYDILSYYVDNTNDFARIAFTSAADYVNFLDTISKKSNIQTNKEYTADTRICTLITCTNGSDADSRYVVHGILNQFIPAADLT